LARAASSPAVRAIARQREASNGTPAADSQAMHGMAADSIAAASARPSAFNLSDRAR
jgi:hypothetical protein